MYRISKYLLFFIALFFALPIFSRADTRVYESIVEFPQIFLDVIVFESGIGLSVATFNNEYGEVFVDIASDSLFTNYVPGFKNYYHGPTTPEDRAMFRGRSSFYGYWRDKSSLKQ